VRLDIGCGTKKEKGYVGIDKIAFEGVDIVCDIGKEKWPLADDSVDEAQALQVVEHLVPEERIHFVNELYRVLKKGAKCLIVTPHWSAARAYGDLTHVWPPVSEFWYPYLNAAWRKDNAPHETRYTCDFDFPPGGYSVREDWKLRNDEMQQFALQNYKEAAQELAQSVQKR
jgi:SAM-dependent methyltransferase